MDSYTGELYTNSLEALKAGVAEEDIVEIIGTQEAIIRVSDSVKAHRRAMNKRARKSRKANRKKK